MAYKNYIPRVVRWKFLDQLAYSLPEMKICCFWCGKIPDDFYPSRIISIEKGKTITWHIDHLYPVSWGGTNDLDNLVLSCPKCNRRKHANYWGDKGHYDREKLCQTLN